MTHPGFETQIRHHHNSKAGASVFLLKGLMFAILKKGLDIKRENGKRFRSSPVSGSCSHFTQLKNTLSSLKDHSRNQFTRFTLKIREENKNLTNSSGFEIDLY